MNLEGVLAPSRQTVGYVLIHPGMQSCLWKLSDHSSNWLENLTVSDFYKLMQQPVASGLYYKSYTIVIYNCNHSTIVGSVL